MSNTFSHPILLAQSANKTSPLTHFARLGLMALFLMVCAASAWAHTSSLGIQDAWIRGSVPGQKNGAAYVEIRNGSNHEMVLESVSSDRADRVELHTIDRESGVARMREVQKINIGAHGEVKLAPGGYHIMLIGLKTPFTPGETVTLLLNFKGEQPMPVDFKVMPATYQPKDAPQGGGHSHTMSH